MGWEVANDNGSSQATLKIGNVGEIIIRNTAPSCRRGGARRRHAAAARPARAGRRSPA